jgi:outer membrane protein assembly factor BamA
MFLPVLSFEDGYGMTYGVRFARPDVAGKGSRVAFPLTWGGEKKAGIEFEKPVAWGAVDRVLAGASVTRRTNPFFDEDDDRQRVWVRGEREIVRAVRAGATAGWQRASFFSTTDTFAHAAADIVVDTRVDPLLPRNAVYARAAWEHLSLGINRRDLDLRAYLGAIGQSVVALRAQRQDADAPLPPYLKPLLGGLPTVRGFKVGIDAGDVLVATSAELIVPLTSPLSIGRMGVSAFVDAGTAYDVGEKLADQRLKQGYGGSVWFSAAFVRLNIAVAHGRGATTRVHVGANVSF